MAGIGVLVYVGDFGETPIADETLRAYSVEFLKGQDRKWRKSSRKRKDVERFYRDIEVVQRYMFKTAKDLDKL